MSSLYSNGVLSTVTLSPQSPEATVALQLGPKAAVVTGTARDARTGKPIPPAFTIRRLDNPKNVFGISMGANFRILIPSSTDVSLEVSSAGYRHMMYADPHTRSQTLRLNPAEEVQSDVLLEPLQENLQSVRFLIPDGYRGWLRVKCQSKEGPGAAYNTVLKFSADGVASTAGVCPNLGPQNDYFYDSPDGSLRAISDDYWAGKGLVWGEHQSDRGGMVVEFAFFVGTEEAYRRAPSPAHGGN
jgi:hypothetical protein